MSDSIAENIEIISTTLGSAGKKAILFAALDAGLAIVAERLPNRLGLTATQQRVLNAVARNKNNIEAASDLGLAPGSVEVYVSNARTENGITPDMPTALLLLRGVLTGELYSNQENDPYLRRVSTGQPLPGAAGGSLIDRHAGKTNPATWYPER